MGIMIARGLALYKIILTQNDVGYVKDKRKALLDVKWSCELLMCSVYKTC